MVRDLGLKYWKFKDCEKIFLKPIQGCFQTTFEDQGLGRGPLMSFPSLLGPGGEVGGGKNKNSLNSNKRY